MSHFYGTINGKAKNAATQCGSVHSGVSTNAASYAGAIRVSLSQVDGVDRFEVRMVPWLGEGESKLIAEGVVGDASSLTL